MTQFTVPSGETERTQTSGGRAPARRSIWLLGAMAAGFLAARAAPANFPEWEGWLWLWPSIGCVCVLAACFSRGRSTPIAMWLAAMCLCAGYYHWRMLAPLSANVLTRAVDAAARSGESDPLPVAVTGLVLDEPVLVNASPRGALGSFGSTRPAWSFTLECREIECAPEQQPEVLRSASVTGRLRVRVDADGGRARLGDAGREAVRPGDRVLVRGVLRPLPPPLNPGETDVRLRARQQGVLASLIAPTELLVRRQPHSSSTDRATGAVRRCLSDLRSSARRLLGEALEGTDAWADAPGEVLGASVAMPSQVPPPTLDPRRRQARALIGSMLLGYDDANPSLRPVSAAFSRLGLTHLIAISGVNMVLLASLGVGVLRLSGDRGVFEPLIIALLVVVYLLVLPAQAPIIRGGVMVLAVLAADALGRRYDRLTVLGWVAVVLGVVWPLDLFSPGYQLSFGVVGALLWVQPVVHERLFGVRIRGVRRAPLPVGRAARYERLGMQARRLIASVIERAGHGLSASIVAWCIACPVIAYHAGVFSPLGILFTLIVAPVCTLVLWAGYIVLLVAAVGQLVVGVFGVPGWEVLTQWLGSVLDGLGLACVGLVDFLDSVPGSSVRVPALSPWLAAAAVALVASFLRTRHTVGSRAVYRRWGRRVAAAAVIACTAWAIAVPSAPGKGSGASPLLRIDALGGTLIGRDGSCLLLRCGPGSGPFTGGRDAALIDCGSTSYAAGLDRIPSVLRALGVTRVRTAVLLSPSLERLNALPDVASAVGLREVYLSPQLEALCRAGRTGGGSRLERGVAAVVDELQHQGVRVGVLGGTEALQLGSGEAGVEVALVGSVERPPFQVDAEGPNQASGQGVRTYADQSALLRVRAGLSAVDRERGARPTGVRSVLLAPALTALGWSDLLTHENAGQLPVTGGTLAGTDVLVAAARAWAPRDALESRGARRRGGPDLIPLRRAAREVRVVLLTGGSVSGDLERDVLCPAQNGHCWVEIGRDGAIAWGDGHAE